MAQKVDSSSRVSVDTFYYCLCSKGSSVSGKLRAKLRALLCSRYSPSAEMVPISSLWVCTHRDLSFDHAPPHPLPENSGAVTRRRQEPRLRASTTEKQRGGKERIFLARHLLRQDYGRRHRRHRRRRRGLLLPRCPPSPATSSRRA